MEGLAAAGVVEGELVEVPGDVEAERGAVAAPDAVAADCDRYRRPAAVEEALADEDVGLDVAAGGVDAPVLRGAQVGVEVALGAGVLAPRAGRRDLEDEQQVAAMLKAAVAGDALQLFPLHPAVHREVGLDDGGGMVLAVVVVQAGGDEHVGATVEVLAQHRYGVDADTLVRICLGQRFSVRIQRVVVDVVVGKCIGHVIAPFRKFQTIICY